jgi:hypothetical protein
LVKTYSLENLLLRLQISRLSSTFLFSKKKKKLEAHHHPPTHFSPLSQIVDRCRCGQMTLRILCNPSYNDEEPIQLIYLPGRQTTFYAEGALLDTSTLCAGLSTLPWFSKEMMLG